MIRPAGVPDDAERLSLQDCKTIVRAPSKFAAPLTAMVENFSCPSCKTEQPEPGYATTVTCPSCGLRMTNDCATYLWIWRDQATVKEEAEHV